MVTKVDNLENSALLLLSKVKHNSKMMEKKKYKN